MKRSPEIEALLRRNFPSLDEEVELATLSNSPDFLAIGTDVGEWWYGRDEFMAVERAQLDETRGQWGSPASPVFRFNHVEAFEDGSVGWAAARSDLVPPDREPVALRSTFVLSLEGGTWRIIHMHHSIGIPNEEVFGIELTTSLEKMTASLDDETNAVVTTVGTATVMFTDIEGSTAASQRMGDKAWSTAMKDHFRMLRRIVESENGIVVKMMGDGGMFVFPSARAGLSAAVKIQQSVSGSPGGSRFQLRIGLHSGDVLHESGDYSGLTVNKAARVASAARGGEIMASAVTAELAGRHGFEFREPRKVALEGLDGIHQIVALGWRPLDRSQTETHG